MKKNKYLERTLAYIAGPLTCDGSGIWCIEKNIRKAEEAGLYVASLGVVPIVVHSMWRFFHGVMDEDVWVEYAISVLARCDVVALYDSGWRRSSGTRQEVDYARTHGIDLVDLDDLGAWIDGCYGLNSAAQDG